MTFDSNLFSNTFGLIEYYNYPTIPIDTDSKDYTKELEYLSYMSDVSKVDFVMVNGFVGIQVSTDTGYKFTYSKVFII